MSGSETFLHEEKGDELSSDIYDAYMSSDSDDITEQHGSGSESFEEDDIYDDASSMEEQAQTRRHNRPDNQEEEEETVIIDRPVVYSPPPLPPLTVDEETKKAFMAASNNFRYAGEKERITLTLNEGLARWYTGKDIEIAEPTDLFVKRFLQFEAALGRVADANEDSTLKHLPVSTVLGVLSHHLNTVSPEGVPTDYFAKLQESINKAAKMNPRLSVYKVPSPDADEEAEEGDEEDESGDEEVVEEEETQEAAEAEQAAQALENNNPRTRNRRQRTKLSAADAVEPRTTKYTKVVAAAARRWAEAYEKARTVSEDAPTGDFFF